MTGAEAPDRDRTGSLRSTKPTLFQPELQGHSAPDRHRTDGLSFTKRVLCQLSYRGKDSTGPDRNAEESNPCAERHPRFSRPAAHR